MGTDKGHSVNLLPAFAGRPAVDAVYHVDAMTLLKALPDDAVSAVITDMPYNTTACEWESDIATSAALWGELWRVSPVVITTCAEPFTSAITWHNRRYYRESLVWEKGRATGFLNAKQRHMVAHEDIRIFARRKLTYNAQCSIRVDERGRVHGGARPVSDTIRDKKLVRIDWYPNGKQYPRSVLKHTSENYTDHPTQKPLTLFEHLILSYTNAGDVVLDPFSGSGTTALAAAKHGRRYIAGDMTLEYVEVARQRLAAADPFAETTLSNGMRQLSLLAEAHHG